MAEEEVPPLVLGEGSPKLARVPPGALRGHMCVVGTPAAAAATVVDVSKWAAGLGAGTVIVDLEGDVTALLVERAEGGALGDIDVRVLSPSSPVGIPVVFKPLSGLSSAAQTGPWKRLRGWLPQLLATLASMGPGTPDHDRASAFFLSLLDRIKEENPSVLTVQGLVTAVREGLEAPDSPVTAEVAQGMVTELNDMAEDLRNAALSYGAPVDLMRLLETPVARPDAAPGPKERHLDVVLLQHMASVADRNAVITALLLEVFAWCQLHGREGKLLVVLPEVKSPTTFIQARPFAQRLAARVLGSSNGTGLLGVVVPSSLEDPGGLPRFGALLLEKAHMDAQEVAIEGVLREQGMSPEAWGRMGMLSPSEWALAAGEEWSKWFRFTPDPEALRERELDSEALDRLLVPEVRDAFKHRPELEGEEEDEEGTEEGEEAPREEDEAARAARVVEDAEDLLSYTTEKKPARGASRVHQEVQELLKRKLEEKERAKEAQRYELKEMDLVEGEEPAEIEAVPSEPRPLSGGVIDDRRDQAAEPSAPRVALHADDLEVELAVMEAREANAAQRPAEEGEPEELVVDLDQPGEGWETVTPEAALGAEATEEGKRKGAEGDEEEEEEEIIVELVDEQ